MNALALCALGEVAVSAAAGADISGLQWLDESKVPLTTLQRLAQARRMAA